MENLSLYIHLYKDGTLKKKDMEEFIFRFILKNPHRFYLMKWEKNRCIDYLCWLYPKLSAAIDAYKDTGSSFEAYLASLLFWSAHDYFCSEIQHSMTEQVCWETRTEDIRTCEEEEEYPLTEEMQPFKNKTGKKVNTNEIMILLLKSYSFVSEDFLERVAPVVGIKVDKLRSMIDKLKKERELHDEGIRKLKMGIHSQYYRCIVFEKRLQLLDENSLNYEKTKGFLERGRKRLANMKKRLAGLRLDASNRQVAEILCIPKGTVDSALYSIKKKFDVK
ncbi:MAG: hypothetical protein LBB61_05265 [Treponema sp.]|jgi:hypothetical protein|nr:hypothetical protein [Treponema sp.]